MCAEHIENCLTVPQNARLCHVYWSTSKQLRKVRGDLPHCKLGYVHLEPNSITTGHNRMEKTIKFKFLALSSGKDILVLQLKKAKRANYKLKINETCLWLPSTNIFLLRNKLMQKLHYLNISLLFYLCMLTRRKNFPTLFTF